ncbi:DUF4232 domain-containing protein [Streptomyces sp. NPDC023723]|uniref:DUF4232 domain-containing protein n=1 Tax=Streptomyces sp. NPDC023723 TaxID=3154323 RepID=UPI00341098B9
MRLRKLTFAALAVAAGLSLTACNGDDGTAQSDGTSVSAASSGSSDSGSSDSAASGTSDTSSGSSGAAGTGTDAGSGKCTTDELEITASDTTIDGDTEGSVAVTFQNGGGQDCSVTGYAGVDLTTSEGELSAERSGQDSDPVVLKDGESVSFNLSYPLNDTGGSGVGITGLVVTPPDETKSVTLDWPGAASLPVTDGTGSSLTVGPMGSAGQGGAS